MFKKLLASASVASLILLALPTTARATDPSMVVASPTHAEITSDDVLVHDGNTWRDDWGLIPGDMFRYTYWITNNGTEPVQLDGFSSHLSSIITNPTVLQQVSADYCDQFFIQIATDATQTFPQIIAPGETAGPFVDNTIYVFDLDAGNECQSIDLVFGTPHLSVDQPNDSNQPEDALDPIAPQAPTTVETAAR